MKAERRMDGWIGLKVRLLREIKTAGGKVYAAGSWWTTTLRGCGICRALLIATGRIREWNLLWNVRSSWANTYRESQGDVERD